MKPRCELFFSSVDPCGSDPCNPDEICVVKGESYLCECRMGYQGDCNNCDGKVCNTWLKNEKKDWMILYRMPSGNTRGLS